MKLLLVIILFLVYFHYIGNYIYQVFNKYLYWNKFKFPIGFITTIGMIQLVSFPMTYLHVSMKVASIVYLFILATLFLLATIYFIWKIIHHSSLSSEKNLREYLFLGLIVIGFSGLHLALTFFTNSLNVASSDQSFYITWIENNVNVDQINMITPLTGSISPLHLFYNFQSYFVFLSFISQLFALPSILISVWAAPVILLTFIATSILNACSYFKIKHKGLIFCFFVIAFIFNFWPIESLAKYNMYIGHLRSYIFIFIIILYYELFNKNKLSHVFTNLVWLAAIAVQSTALFNGYLFIAALILYDLFIAKKKLIFELFKSSLALHLYLFFFLRYSWHYKISTAGLILVLIGLLMDKVPVIKEKIITWIYHDNMKKAVIWGYGALVLLVLIITNYGYINPPISSSYFVEYLSDYYFNNTYYSLMPFSLLNTTLKLIFLGLNIYLITKVKTLKDPMKFFIQLQIIFFIFFYNPLVAPFISTFITGSVFFRLRDVIYFVPFTIVCFLYAMDHFKYGKKFIVGVTILGGLLGVINIYEYLTFSYNKIPDSINYEYAYRLPKDTVKVAQFLDEYITNELSVDDQEIDRPLVYSVNRQINYFSHSYEMFYTIHEERNLKNINMEESLKALDKYALEELVVNSENYKDELYRYGWMLLKHNIDFIVLDNSVSKSIKTMTTQYYDKIYNNDTFSVYELKKRR